MTQDARGNHTPRKRRQRPGGPPSGAPWVWLTAAMLGSPTYQALDANGRRVLDFLMLEHLAHGGKENGNLAAPHRQLAAFGVTKDYVAPALDTLIRLGFVRRTFEGLRLADNGKPARFALTWLPTKGDGFLEPPTHDWKRVLGELARQELTTARQIRDWLKRQDDIRRPLSVRRPRGVNIYSAPDLRGDGPTDTKGKIVALNARQRRSAPEAKDGSPLT